MQKPFIHMRTRVPLASHQHPRYSAGTPSTLCARNPLVSSPTRSRQCWVYSQNLGRFVDGPMHAYAVYRVALGLEQLRDASLSILVHWYTDRQIGRYIVICTAHAYRQLFSLHFQIRLLALESTDGFLPAASLSALVRLCRGNNGSFLLFWAKLVLKEKRIQGKHGKMLCWLE